MSVLFETSLGDIIVDLETTLCPTLSLNFLKLCKTYYYNFNSFHHIIPQFIAQTGDPTDTGTGGRSIWNSLPSSSAQYQHDPFFIPPRNETALARLKHTHVGTLSMALSPPPKDGGEGGGACGSQFFFTLADDLDFLDGKHAPFGKVIEGLDTLTKVGESFLDQDGKPLRDIRIRHVIVLDDPFPDPPGLLVPPESPTPTAAQLASLRVGEDEDLAEDEDPEIAEQRRREHDAKAQALTLEMVGDLPFADVAPPENVLFVCKLNQITTSEDLELIFSRFGKILSCEIIKDQKTGDSLQYAFIEFEERDSAEKAYVKMDNVLVDDRRIHVDFSQSVSKLHNSYVFNKTGGRPPPNKHKPRDRDNSGGRRDRGDYDDDNRDSRRYDSRSRDHGANGFVFDMNEVDDRNRDRRGTGGHRGNERRGYDRRDDDRRPRDEGRDKRRDDDRRRDEGRRRDERDRSPRGSGRDRERGDRDRRR
ncbi:PPIL4 family peptidylprolyl isomerase [Sporobolomyces koalae]|uniref:PPIL4 family peptidylprolyl isomerase n=1 Tax=Sporobolomyces koalae TaxID=500713 RepID=UPI0031764258